jgi:PHD/YefM family antitoxin component YafN of YafNO toxin-antitoxin module
MLETLELLSLPGFRQRLKASIKQMKAGETVSMDELFGEKK